MSISRSSESAPLRLDQFLKLSGLADTGGQAKLLIQGGEVMVNGQVETRRRHKLSPTDVVTLGDQQCMVNEVLGDDQSLAGEQVL